MLTFEEQRFRSLEEADLAFWSGDGVQLSVRLDPVRGIVAVQDGAKYRRQICLLPYFRSRVVPGKATSASERPGRDLVTYLSPRRSITYASTPPGIFTSTLTSTRENALKQLPQPRVSASRAVVDSRMRAHQ